MFSHTSPSVHWMSFAVTRLLKYPWWYLIVIGHTDWVIWRVTTLFRNGNGAPRRCSEQHGFRIRQSCLQVRITQHQLFNLHTSQLYFCFNNSMGHIIQARQTRPWLQPDWLFRLFPLGSEQKRCLSILHGFTDEVHKGIGSFMCLLDIFRNGENCVRDTDD